MSGTSDKSQKTEEATPKKVRDARREGQVAKSPEVAAWGSMLVISLVLPWTAGQAADAVTDLAAAARDVLADPDEGKALALLATGLREVLVVVLPLSVVLAATGVLAGAAQVGVMLAPKAVKPQAKRLNPWPGLKRIVGPQAMWGTVKEVLKLAVLAALGYRAVSDAVPPLLAAGGLPLGTVLAQVGSAALEFMRAAAALGLVIAVADLAYQRRTMRKQLRMSKKEVRDEHKQTEGDPMLKGAIRSRQLAMSRNRMMAEVATADVVLVNPTHVAVALRYRPHEGAPRVVAKGAGAVAAKIRERAEEHGVPMVRDVALARAVHAACDLGDPVPPQLYSAVARVLAFVLSLRARGSVRGVRALPAALPA
jgi:flagellar biosynthesis protein FlhB